MTMTTHRPSTDPPSATPEDIVDAPKPLSPFVAPAARIGVVAIGRNEGERLVHCLQSVVGKVGPVVYVDSGSSDNSLGNARRIGADIVQLDTSSGFSAARARNAGFERLMEIDPRIDLVQFVDGDCQVQDGWLERAEREMALHPKVAAVCGRRRERYPERSLYNRMIDLEWDTPIGPAKSCGGDSMVRVAAFKEVGGFNPTVTAGEEPELCLRLRTVGWTILRINAEMTLHDAAMLRFGQWWKRQTRGGYGATDVATRFGKADGLFVSQVKSAQTWGLIYPIFVVWIAAIGLIFSWKIAVIAGAVAALAWPLQWARLSASAVRRGRSKADAIAWSWLIMLGKFPQAVGQLKYYRDRMAGRGPGLIEYKKP
jgi:glycosyltransferase involved in cell wall biosynthesis